MLSITSNRRSEKSGFSTSIGSPSSAAARASGSLLPVLLEQGLPALVQSTLLTALLAVGGMLPAVEYRLLALLPGLLPRVPAANRFAQVFLSLLLPLLFLIAISEDWSVPAEQQETPAKGRRALAWGSSLFLRAGCPLTPRPLPPEAWSRRFRSAIWW